ncbi:hypothetical protein MUK42_34393 [Musa troglodytarum]|uniref:Retrovirus-related Pol polyprotein from transposon TNT 1-94-like beta-barrel domain-containing protein n=1 Tax=Musa troglodytarum TaxID=320322 RepID=A0A9E7JBY7_9LILI|nr:hypothetical protein MUK42_34393 [Musa troglodytarum]
MESSGVFARKMSLWSETPGNKAALGVYWDFIGIVTSRFIARKLEDTVVSLDGLRQMDLEWIIDTGASYHATPRREFFTTYRSGNFGVVKMGNHGTTDIIGMGDIHIKTNLGCKLVLKDVRHVVDLRLNLISVRRLHDEDYDSRLQAKACGEQLNATEKDFSMELWHRSHDIQHEMTVPGTPQHNAIAERINRTIIEKIRYFRIRAKRYRSRDVVFFEDQTLEDLKKEAPANTSTEGLADYDPVVPPVYQDDGGDVQEDGVEPDINLLVGHVEQEEVEEQLPTEPQLRRSSRQRQPSRRYYTDEYVILTDAGELESYQEAVESIAASQDLEVE